VNSSNEAISFPILPENPDTARALKSHNTASAAQSATGRGLQQSDLNLFTSGKPPTRKERRAAERKVNKLLAQLERDRPPNEPRLPRIKYEHGGVMTIDTRRLEPWEVAQAVDNFTAVVAGGAAQ